MRWVSDRKFHPGLLALLLLLADCGDGGSTEKPGEPHAAAETPQPVFRADGALADLTGLWEAGAMRTRSQMCVIETGSAPTRFALVFRAEVDRSCSGGGTLRRVDGGLRFTMAGESDCAFDATLDGRTITVAENVPAGCAYYCTAGTSLQGARFTLVAASVEDARRARDLVGEPLCGAPRPVPIDVDVNVK